jgi:hypothetical protein
VKVAVYGVEDVNFVELFPPLTPLSTVRSKSVFGKSTFEDDLRYLTDRVLLSRRSD